jgi:hypothetical protein
LEKTNKKSKMISLAVLLVGVCVVAAQPLVPEQHTALMNVFDGLGETNKTTTETNKKN